MRIVFLGAPGAGKGTQAEKIAEKLALPTISTGAIIRGAIKAGTELGKTAQSYSEKGALVPDDVVIGIIKERLEEKDCKKGFILDGFPRTVPQAKALDEMGCSIDAVISLEVSDEDIVQRMSGRRVCPACGATFHITANPSGAGDRCERCGALLTVRKDDLPEVVLSRLKIYHEACEPLKDFYRGKGVLHEISGKDSMEDITAQITLALGVR